MLEPDALDKLMESTGGDPEFVAILLETFANDAPGLLDELRSGLEAGDTDSVRRAAHTLKSNAATFGATVLAEMCGELEASARSGDLTDGKARLADIESTYARVETQLTTLCGQLA
jgi:HPt (histidine-containing phosphotransfer) domain-containing protein